MLAKTKVLAISRDNALLNFLRRELGGEEFEVVTTQHTGVQLKGVIDNERPGFIILDICMPTLDGIGVCLQLRQWTQTPVLMLSTWNTGNGMVRGLNLSNDSYLTEPFSASILKKRIRETLKRNELTDLMPDIQTRKN